ncbi:DUF3558 domain-containing protein [Prauserella muralis]|uniref:Uncharacterized protein n=1 Tax=Prauserella muralis TaxID=588067 RepID=A0A2V4B8Q5_9PSEU|nr:DUF3558 domain-containing protein [Prauserella muralis]PXY31630.1 hypothetical protein BAY60_04485 [Prauserella muralis]TWE14005.1 uncharacterized protein DUF3558 [Prauserella muralis]
MGRSRIGLATGVLAAALVLGACGSDVGGTPETGAPTSAAGGSPATSAGGQAPDVADPLDAAPLASSPCEALSAADLATLGFAEGEQRPSGESGTACVWHEEQERGNRVDLSVVTENANGLDAVYEQRSSNAYFEPAEIAGYPAVYTATLDERDDGGCGLWVGLNDSDTLFVLTNYDYGPGVSDPCSVADRVAEAAITNLGG